MELERCMQSLNEWDTKTNISLRLTLSALPRVTGGMDFERVPSSLVA